MDRGPALGDLEGLRAFISVLYCLLVHGVEVVVVLGDIVFDLVSDGLDGLVAHGFS